MNITNADFFSRVSLSFLPTEPLLGVRIINCHVLTGNDSYKPLIGLELGLLFFKISYTKLFLKD